MNREKHKERLRAKRAKDRERLKALDAKYKQMSGEMVERAQELKAKLADSRRPASMPNYLPLNTGAGNRD